MRVTAVIQKNDDAWQDVSPFWNDTISRRFQDSVISELDTILRFLDQACETLENKTYTVNSKLHEYENL
jgi:hypothetical protein